MTAYELRISDWSSDVGSSDLQRLILDDQQALDPPTFPREQHPSVLIRRSARSPISLRHRPLTPEPPGGRKVFERARQKDVWARRVTCLRPEGTAAHRQAARSRRDSLAARERTDDRRWPHRGRRQRTEENTHELQ